MTIPPGATILEGIPSVRVDLTPHAVTRRVLGTREAAENRLEIRVRNGQFFWASRGDELLHVDIEGAYTYLSSKPGHYIKFTKVKDKITYVEHLENRDFGSGSVTYWGELSIVLR